MKTIEINGSKVNLPTTKSETKAWNREVVDNRRLIAEAGAKLNRPLTMKEIEEICNRVK